MTDDEKVTSLMNKLSQAYTSTKNSHDLALAKFILKLASALNETGDVNFVSDITKICISFYKISVKGPTYQFSPAILDLYNECLKNKGSYDPSLTTVYFGGASLVRMIASAKNK